MLISLFIAGVILAADQFTKLLVQKSIHPYESISILPFLHLVNVKNQGAAFGLFQSFGNLFFISISSVAVVVILVWMYRSRGERVGLSLVLGGALGNMIDRIRLGYVTDFIDIFAGRYHWPAFNIADSALTIGIGILFIQTMVRRK
jgi:signal peptidase II